jgi:predicted nucleic acid-binding protein
MKVYLDTNVWQARRPLPMLGAALQAKADVLVTGDLELQNLKKIGNLLILSARGFWEKLRAGNEASADIK